MKTKNRLFREHLPSPLSIFGVLVAPLLAWTILTSAFANPPQTIPLSQIQNNSSLEATVLFPNTGSDVSVYLPRRAITADELLVVYNTSDPVSVFAANQYQAARGIPSQNMLSVTFPPPPPFPGRMPELAFNASIKSVIDAALVGRDDIQAIVVTWTNPWGVSPEVGGTLQEAVSVCWHLSGRSPELDFSYIGSDITRPWDELGFRPVMMLAAEDMNAATRLITSGLASDNTFPLGDGYLVRTSDQFRNEMWPQLLATELLYNSSELALTSIDSASGTVFDNGITSLPALLAANNGDFLANTSDVLFYFTGAATIPLLETNTYVNGAFAQHVTSGGGTLTLRDSDFFQNPPVPYATTQMSILNWTEQAGVVGSYGNTEEPEGFPQQYRFVNPFFFLPSYLGGNTLIEAAWKSVVRPSTGAFVGDPLARPYGWAPAPGQNNSVRTSALRTGSVYSTYASSTVDGDPELFQTNISAASVGFDDIAYPSSAKTVYVAEEQSKAAYKELRTDSDVGCGFEVNGIAVWCTDRSNLWRSPSQPGDDGLITNLLIFNSATAHGNSVFWIEDGPTQGTDGIVKQWDVVADQQTDLFSIPTSNTPILSSLRVSDAYVVWAESTNVSELEDGVATRLLRYDRGDGSIDVIAATAGPVQLPDTVFSFDLDGQKLVFLGKAVGNASPDVYLTDGDNLPQNLTSTSDTLSTVAISGDSVVWIQEIGGNNRVMFRDATGPVVELEDAWELPGEVAAVDFENSVVVMKHDLGDQGMLTLYDVTSQTSALLTNPFGFANVVVRNEMLGDGAYFPARSALATLSDQATVSQTGVGPSEPLALLGYDLDIVDAMAALDAATTTLSAGESEPLGLYLRPSEAYVYDGVATYEATMADGSPLVAGVTLNSPDPSDTNDPPLYAGDAGDLNRDGAVNTVDLGIMKNAFFSSDSRSDLNNDGTVNSVDLGVLGRNFFGNGNHFFGYIEWYPSVTGGSSIELQVTVTLNGTASIRKNIVLTAE